MGITCKDKCSIYLSKFQPDLIESYLLCNYTFFHKHWNCVPNQTTELTKDLVQLGTELPSYDLLDIS